MEGKKMCTIVTYSESCHSTLTANRGKQMHPCQVECIHQLRPLQQSTTLWADVMLWFDHPYVSSNLSPYQKTSRVEADGV